MIRYRFGILLACSLSALLYLSAWHAADAAPGVQDAGEGLAVPLDDSAIYFQYARQALHGEWLRYSPGAELSTGVTSPLYFVLLTGLMGLGASGPVAAWLLGAAALLLGLVAMDGISRRLFPALPPWWAPLLLLGQGAWVAWSFNGMETGWLMSLSLCAVLTALSERRALFLASIAALAFTRPEGQVLAGLLVLAWAIPRGDARTLALGALLCASPSVLLFALSGSLTPDSLRPKTTVLQSHLDAWGLMAQFSTYAVGLLKGAWMGFWSGQDTLGVAGDATALNPVAPLFPPLLLLGALFGYFGRGRERHRGLWLAIAAALAGIAGLLSWQLPVGWHEHRYLAATAPLLWLGALGGLDALRREAGLARRGAAALFSLWLAFGLASWPWHLQRVYSGALNYALANRNTALELRALPAGPVAVVDAGLIAYYSGHPIVDLPGITDHRLALAEPLGKGAVLESLLARDPLPRWAALHRQRPDFDVKAWTATGLLDPIAGADATAMALYQWDWRGADQRLQPGTLPKGWRSSAGLNVADPQQERAAQYRALGPHADSTRIMRLLLSPRETLVPEGARTVLSESFDRQGQALMLRGVFDRPGRLRISGRDGRSLLFAAISASPSAHYSELLLPLAPEAPQRIVVTFEDEKGQPSEWSSCRYWFLEPTDR